MLNNFLSMLKKNDEGQDLLEYALLVALIAIVAVGAVTAAGLPVVDDLHADRGRHLGGQVQRARRPRMSALRAHWFSTRHAPQQTASSTTWIAL